MDLLQRQIVSKFGDNLLQDKHPFSKTNEQAHNILFDGKKSIVDVRMALILMRLNTTKYAIINAFLGLLFCSMSRELESTNMLSCFRG